MTTTLRVATFNCENLFSRPKIFGESPQRSQLLLGFVQQLEAELRKDVFDHKAIDALKEKLGAFATINDVRGKHATAKGAKTWFGWVELTRGANADIAVVNTAHVIADTDADVICLSEVESRIQLQGFHDSVLVTKFLKPAGKDGYKYILLIDGNDDRGIDIAVMSRANVPVRWLRSNIQDTTTYLGNTVRTFSRDCLEVGLDLPGGLRLDLLLNHFKSKASGPQGDPIGAKRREGQAMRVAEIANVRNLASDHVIVAGDLNDTPDSAALRPLLSIPKLYNVNLSLPAGDRGTYRNGEQIDYLLVSDPLKAALGQVRVERRGMVNAPNHYPTVSSDRSAASDHGAVVAEFQLP